MNELIPAFRKQRVNLLRKTLQNHQQGARGKVKKKYWKVTEQEGCGLEKMGGELYSFIGAWRVCSLGSKITKS